jgi:hypothetical protein
MTYQEHLLTCLGEECSELHKGATKSLRFGLFHQWPERDKVNAHVIVEEFCDLVAVMELLQPLTHLDFNNRALVEDKKIRLKKFMKLSVELGALQLTEQEKTLVYGTTG